MIDRETLRDILYQLESDVADLPFWEGCERGEFLLHRCNICGEHYWPAVKCVEHGGRDMQWIPASGRGEVHVWTIQHIAHNPDWRGKVPYNVCVIKLEEGPFFHSNVIDCPNDEISSGLKVTVTFQEHPNGMTVPAFSRAAD